MSQNSVHVPPYWVFDFVHTSLVDGANPRPDQFTTVVYTVIVFRFPAVFVEMVHCRIKFAPDADACWTPAAR